MDIMTIPATMHYFESVVPPRCRKPRDVRQTEAVTRTIVTARRAEAPVAFEVDDYCQRSSGKPPTRPRWFDERLWLPYGPPRSPKDEPVVKIDERARIHRLFGRVDRYDDRAAAEAAVEVTDFMFIGRALHRIIGEPRYVVMTFGLGCNHGGTALMDEWGYNSNIGRDRYFRADQWREALDSAIATADARGDTRDAATLRRQRRPQIRVCISDAVRCQPAAEHGDGDPFLNKLYALTTVKNPTVAALGAIAALAEETVRG